MNKKIISLIIGVLTIAIFGLVAIQTGLILDSIRANEEAFDKNVHNAMSIVAERLEKAATDEDVLAVINGYSKEYFHVEESEDPQNENGGISIPTGHPYGDEILKQLKISQAGLCENCRKKAKQNFPEIDEPSYKYINTQRPISERVDAQNLSEILAQTLQNNAIKTEYEFGIFSDENKAFVIHNGQYLPDLTSSEVDKIATPLLNLQASPYKVTLFNTEDDNQAAGSLNLFFPEKNAAIWRKLLPSFISTFLFTAIILGCFGYTIWVIFQQKRLSEMRTDFINNMTHEFKTPIATISLAADSITNPRVSGDISKLTRFANIIKQENKRMNSQVEKVLQIAQIDRGESKLRLSEVDLHDIIHHAIENIDLQVEKRNGTAKAILNASQPVVEGDQTHISNVINNLLDNANKYSPNTPEITVYTEDLPKGIQVTISDKGMGLSKEARKHIFERFYRVHTGDRHDIKGFGLGLSYVKTIMKTHKGSVEVKSELDKGSDFILFFPYKQNAS